MTDPEPPTTWAVKETSSGRHIRIARGDQVEKVPVTVREWRGLTQRYEAFESLMAVFAPAVLDYAVKINLSRLAKLHTLTTAHFKSLSLADDDWTRLAMVLVYCERPATSPASALRLAQVLKRIPAAKYTQKSHDLLTHVTVQKISLDQWLDTLNFFLNGESNTTFKAFQASHGGAVFSLPSGLRESHTAPHVTRSVFYRETKPFVNRNTLKLLMHRFLQLSRRSKKLENKLHLMPLAKVVQALDFDIPGTLLVNDTIELLDSLKYVELRNLGTARYGELEAYLGHVLAGKVAKLKLTKDVLRFVQYQYGQDAVTFIRDTSRVADNAAFIAHGMRKLGVAETVAIMNTIDFETEGVTMRGWMELVRRGGFTGPEPPGWTTVLLP